ncbi:hypothetical protein DFP73DRAFT_557216 [Morchella snyderi]|nr:hypothetical protein DFP73DRAFT_557216 [Morchella snyderi]
MQLFPVFEYCIRFALGLPGVFGLGYYWIHLKSGPGVIDLQTLLLSGDLSLPLLAFLRGSYIRW